MFAFLLKREFQQRYTGNVAGVAWALLNPLLTSLSFVMIFSVFMSSKMGGSAYANFSFSQYYFLGFAGWFLFSDGIVRSLGIIKSNAPLLKSMRCNDELFIWAALVVSVVSAAVVLVLAVALTYFNGNFVVGAYFWTAPIWIVLIAVLTLALMYFCAAVALYFPDMTQAVPILLNFWFFGTPILYTLDTVQSSFPPMVRSLILANPMTVFVEGLRSALVLPDLTVSLVDAGTAAVVVFAALVLCRMLFKQLQPTFNDVI